MKVNQVFFDSIVRNNKIDDYLEKNQNIIEELKLELKNLNNDKKNMNTKLKIIKKKVQTTILKNYMIFNR